MGWFSRRRPSVPVDPFDLARPLFRVSDSDIVTLGQACEGVLICGATGAGKTSGPGDLIARALLNAGAGFLVLCAKVDECERWERLCHEAGRSGGGGGDEKFWALLAAKIVRRCIAIAQLGIGVPSLGDVRRVLMSLPHTPEQAVSREWALGSFAGRCLAAAVDRQLTGADARLLEQCGAFVEEWAALSEKTRSIGLTMVDNVLDRFLFGETADLVAAGETNLSPDDVLSGKIVVLDVPVLRYGPPGRFTSVAWRLLLQRRVLQRDPRENPKPVVIWVDEAQFFVVPSADCMAQSVARQARMVTVMLTQSIPLLVQELGGTPKAEQEVTALLTNLQTKILCQNTCPVTNEAFSKLLGEHRDVLYSGSSQMGNEFDFVGDLMGAPPSASCSYSEQFRPQFEPWRFGALKKGGPAHGFEVEAVVFQGGRVWSNGRTWLVSTFEQPR